MQCNISLGKSKDSSSTANRLKLQKNFCEGYIGLDLRPSQLWISTAWVYVSRTDSDWLPIWELFDLFSYICKQSLSEKRQKSMALPPSYIFSI